MQCIRCQPHSPLPTPYAPIRQPLTPNRHSLLPIALIDLPHTSQVDARRAHGIFAPCRPSAFPKKLARAKSTPSNLIFLPAGMLDLVPRPCSPPRVTIRGGFYFMGYLPGGVATPVASRRGPARPIFNPSQPPGRDQRPCWSGPQTHGRPGRSALPARDRVQSTDYGVLNRAYLVPHHQTAIR